MNCNWFPLAKKPSLSVSLTDKAKDAKGLTEIAFQAEGSSAARIEFYSWDFDYNPEKHQGFKPEILLDKTGTATHKFKPGQHSIACKVVDNDGLENVEVVKLKVNGVVERN